MRAFQQIIATFLFVSLLAIVPAGAQENTQNKGKFTDRLVYGGGMGLQFGTLTLIDLSPVVGYRITERLEAGTGFTYKYYRYKDYYIDAYTGRSYDLKTNILGGSVYARYHILENIFAHTEFESLRYKYNSYYNPGSGMFTESNTAIINSFFVGGGYRQRISQSAYFYILALWNLGNDALSPYSNPVLRMGVMLGR